ncbi:hypothetical protein DY000_02005120 [Brassica cretica]|uniref:Protein FAR1-RELATED SEQUENCE n=1 Tax=Brassica cretica TaxID=69181 RepID=A0ABQ7C5H3_BRACR|nr:hypothetical protein DY000_02005120 [Brassica cretica]
MRLNLLDCGIMRKRYTSLIEDQLWRLRQYSDQYLEACKDSTGCMQKAKDCIRYMTVGDVHEIEYHNDSYRVEMRTKTCGCGLLLDSQVEAAICEGNGTSSGDEALEKVGRLPILPPPSRGNKGRPNNYARKKGPYESTTNKYKLTRHDRTGTCSNCKKEGHNKTRCSNPTAPPPAKRPRGRPKKYQGESSEAVSSQAGSTQASQPRSSQGRFGFST